jgi:hypothetical protein
VIPFQHLLHRSKLDNDDLFWFPIAFDRLNFAAADKIATAVFGNGFPGAMDRYFANRLRSNISTSEITYAAMPRPLPPLPTFGIAASSKKGG